MELKADVSLLTPNWRKSRISSILNAERAIQAGIIVGAIIIWEILGRIGLLYGLVPTFSATIQATWTLLVTGKIWPDIVVSCYEIGAGTLIAVVSGVIVGFILAPIEYVRKVFEPLVVYFGSVPKVILFPIALLVASIGPESKIVLGAVSGFVPILLNIMVGFREVDEKYVKMAKSKGATRFQLYQKVYLPAMVYPVFAGIRLGLGVAITGALLGETKAANHGLGFITQNYYENFSVASMYAVLLIIFVGAGIINLIMTAILARLTKFKASDIEQRRAIM